MRQLFYGFSRSSVTHLRIVINHFGTWLRDIGPQYIFELARFVPDLEEISLDQLGMVKEMPLPGDLVSPILDGVTVSIVDTVPRSERLGRRFSNIQETPPYRIC